MTWGMGWINYHNLLSMEVAAGDLGPVRSPLLPCICIKYCCPSVLTGACVYLQANNNGLQVIFYGAALSTSLHGNIYLPCTPGALSSRVCQSQ